MRKPDIAPGSFTFRLSCYQEFGWTPHELRTTLADFPQECALLAVYFEEYSLKQAEDAAEIARQSRSGSGSSAGMDVDAEIGADDEIDWYEAQQSGLV